MNVTKDISGAIISLNTETLNAVMSVLGTTRDNTASYVLNEFYDAVSDAGFNGEGFVTSVGDNPNHDPEDEEMFPTLIPILFDED